MPAEDRLLVLDVHGVVFTNPLLGFLRETARRRGLEAEGVIDRWQRELRRAFWLGSMDEREMWARLFPADDPRELSAALESRYEAGPLLPALADIEGPIWLLSNHRSEWLLPRISRFGLAGRFERVYVSDRIGFVKPDAGAFRFARAQAGDRRILYVDDKPANVAAAARVFDEARLVGEVELLGVAAGG